MAHVDSADSSIVVPVGPLNTDAIEHYDPLFHGVRDMVDVAIERLRTFEPPEGYYLAFSGGKDSCAVKALADQAGVKYDAHYSCTGIDAPELVRFIRTVHPDVRFEMPRVSFLSRLVVNGFPQRQRRWCCAEYKETGGHGRLVLTGIRAEESARRAGRRMVEACRKDERKHYLHPILDWSAVDVWSFLRANGVPTCSLYAEGYKRLGCLFCPMAGSERNRQAERWPKYREAFRAAFVRLYERRGDRPAFARWKNGSEMFDWWLNEPDETDPDQGVMFE